MNLGIKPIRMMTIHMNSTVPKEESITCRQDLVIVTYILPSSRISRFIYLSTHNFILYILFGKNLSHY